MTFHLVLFRPRRGLPDEDRDGLVAAMRAAAAGIPSVRRFVIGERVANPPQYVLSGFPDFPYMAWLEFDDEAGLKAMAERNREKAALIYDFNGNDNLRELER